MAYNNIIKYPNTRGTMSFMNTDSTLEKSKLYVDYWNGMIKISIAPMIEGTDTKAEFPQFDDKTALSAYIRQSKAHVLMYEISKFLKDGNNKNAGVRSGDNLILISRPEEFPKANNLVLSIIKFVPKTNEVKEMRHYEFKSNYHCAIRNYDVSNAKFDTVYEYDTLEVQEFMLILKAYVEASTSAFSADLLYKDTFERTRYNDKINAIAKNLGVDISYKPNNGSTLSYQQQYQNNNSYVTDEDIPF